MLVDLVPLVDHPETQLLVVSVGQQQNPLVYSSKVITICGFVEESHNRCCVRIDFDVVRVFATILLSGVEEKGCNVCVALSMVLEFSEYRIRILPLLLGSF